MQRSLTYAPYPDPAYPGEIGVTPRRFWIGPVRNGTWDGTNPNEWVYMNYQIPWQKNRSWDEYGGWFNNINIVDPANSYIEVDIDPGGGGNFPTWTSGSEIYQNLGNVWTTVLPWDSVERAFWLYPNPITTDTKIYYNNESTNGFSYSHEDFSWNVESAGNGSVAFTVSPSNPDVVWHYYFSDNMESVVTECGEDDNGTWIKVRPYTEMGRSQIHVCAGNGLIVAPKSTEIQDRWIEIAPWGRKTRTGCIYVTDGPGNRIVQRETPSLTYMSEYTDANINYPTGICNDGTYLYVINRGNQKLVKYSLGDPNTGLATDLVYNIDVSISPATSPKGMCTDGTNLYYVAQNTAFGHPGLVARQCSDLSEWANITNFDGSTSFTTQTAVTVDGMYVYVADADAQSVGSSLVYKFDKLTCDFVSKSYFPLRLGGLDNDGTNLYAYKYGVLV